MSSKNKNRNYTPYENNEETDMSSSNVETTSSASSSSFTSDSVSKSQTQSVQVKPATSVKVDATPKQTATTSPAKAKLLAAIAKYEAVVAGTEKSTKSPVELFHSIIVAVISCDSVEVYDEFYSYFFSHRESTMTNTKALKGIHRITDPNKKSTISAFYAIFFAMVRAKVERSGFHLSVAAIRRAIRNERFVNWIVGKMQ